MGVARRPSPRRRARSSSNRGPDSGCSIPTSPDQASGPPDGSRVALWLATAGPAGYAPVAPGSFGSAAGVLLYLPLSGLAPALYAVTVAGLLALGVWASDAAERCFGVKDDGRIVIDEVVGQLLTLAPLVFLAAPGRRRGALWLAAGFLLFRLFDIWKPGPVAWGERAFRGGAGVMMDDVFAGLLAALALGSLYASALALGVSR